MTKGIGKINHSTQLDWSKNTCFGPLIKMDMSINIKKIVNQLEPFEKSCFIIVSYNHLELIIINFLVGKKKNSI